MHQLAYGDFTLNKIFMSMQASTPDYLTKAYASAFLNFFFWDSTNQKNLLHLHSYTTVLFWKKVSSWVATCSKGGDMESKY